MTLITSRPKPTPWWLWGSEFVMAVALAPIGLVTAGYFTLICSKHERLGWMTLFAIALGVTLVVWVFR